MNPYMACDAPNPFLIWSWLRISFAAYWTSRVNRGRQGIEMKAKHRCCSTCWVNNQNKMVRLPPGLAITVVSAGPHHPDRECNDDSTHRKYPAVQICFWWAIAWIYPPKQYLKGKDGAPITDPKDIANEHAAAFTDNSSSAHYSARFQTIKAQDERARIDFTSDNTEVYNKPFRLRDLRRSILKAKPRAPGPDGIHNNLLKHLPEDTLKILKEILNFIWISWFPSSAEGSN